MHPEVNNISNRLSLRKPRRDSLEALGSVLELIGFEGFVAKGGTQNVEAALESVRAAFPTAQEYQPDFVAELADRIVMLEVKAENEIETPQVQEKARAAREWCLHASTHSGAHGGKPWEYHLISHSAIQANMSLDTLLRQKSLT